MSLDIFFCCIKHRGGGVLMEKPMYYCFATPGNKYMYVRNIHSIVRLPENEFKELQRANKENDYDCDTVRKYRKLGVFIDNPIKKIEHPDTDILKLRSKNHCKLLTLQVTQQCNLRCEYCAYSGIYKNRTHSNKRMSFETAKKAIDFFLSHSRDSDNIGFGFYGGEPLLEVPLIEKCIDYISKNVEGKEVNYAITTNGTLLSNSVIDFLKENQFLLAISLDGSKEEHDKHRKFASGKGSFDTIMNNIRKLKEKYPEYAEKIIFMPVISPDIDLNKTVEYFSNNELISGNSVRFNTIAKSGLEKDIGKYSQEKFAFIYDYEYLKLLLAKAGKIDLEKIGAMSKYNQNEHDRFYSRIDKHNRLLEKFHHGGPCMPGIARLFVTVDGKFFPCERVSETNSEYCIGDINSGFDYTKMEELLNLGKITQNECKKCWNIVNCTICAASLPPDDNGINREKKLSLCSEEKQKCANLIYETAVLTEFASLNEWNGVKRYE